MSSKLSQTNWRESAMTRSVIITDAWEVTKTYAGRIAEWVLFLCMIANIIEILPGVVFWPVISNIVLGVQVVMLDIGGFSLASMADHARNQGDLKAAKKASITGGFLIAIMIVTLLLVSVGLLWHEAKYYTDIAEKGLILVRVVMTVIYGHVIHSLRRQDEMGIQQKVQQGVQVQIEEITRQFTQAAEQRQALLVQSVKQMLHTTTLSQMQMVEQVVHTALQQAPFATSDQVQSTLQQLVTDQVQVAIEQGQNALLGQIHMQVERLAQEMKRDLRTTDPMLRIVQGQSGSLDKGSSRVTKRVRPLTPVVQTEPVSEPPGEVQTEPVNVRVTRFIQEQVNQGRTPSLSEIVEQCHCSRNTAIRYRREIVGDEEERSA